MLGREGKGGESNRKAPGGKRHSSAGEASQHESPGSATGKAAGSLALSFSTAPARVRGDDNQMMATNGRGGWRQMHIPYPVPVYIRPPVTGGRRWTVDSLRGPSGLTPAPLRDVRRCAECSVRCRPRSTCTRARCVHAGPQSDAVAAWEDTTHTTVAVAPSPVSVRVRVRVRGDHIRTRPSVFFFAFSVM